MASTDTTAAEPAEGRSLYAKHQKVYPQSVSGLYRNIKWGLLIVTLGIYYLLPFVRWDRGPDAPDQAVLVDFPARRFYFFFIELWPQEVYYFTGLLILAAIALFLMNAIAGRLWCGYLCWQTVWTDLFLLVEGWVEGDRRDRMKLDAGPWTFGKIRKKITKQILWLIIAWWTGGAWVLYFADAPTLVYELATFQAPMTAWIWIGIFTFTTYILAGFAREQVCIYMCPWPRIQAALTDDEAMNVTYRYDRGEPRGSVKKKKALALQGERTGDCVDCLQCVHVCPTGVDIRKGLQLDCIMCGLCIDACDNIMEKLDLPKGLIAYDTDLNIQRRLRGEENVFKPVRPRTLIYAAVLIIASSLMLYSLLTRDRFGINVLHDRNPTFVQLSSGGVRNGYTVRLLNMRRENRSFAIDVEGLPNATIEVVGVTEQHEGRPLVIVHPDTTREIRVLLKVPTEVPEQSSIPITFKAHDLATGEVLTANDFFKGPGR